MLSQQLLIAKAARCLQAGHIAQLTLRCTLHLLITLAEHRPRLHRWTVCCGAAASVLLPAEAAAVRCTGSINP